MEIYLIRHTSVDVPSGVCYGQSDVALKPTFEKEAATVKENIYKIKEEFISEFDFNIVLCSPLSRCVKLADYCGYQNAIRDNRIMEINFGEWEMQQFDLIKDPQLQEWYKDYFHVRATNGESFEDLYARVCNFLSELKNREKGFAVNADNMRVAIFTHGGVIICARMFAGDISKEEAFNSITPYGGIVKIKLR